MNTKVLHNLTCGLYLLASRNGEKRSGCIINTVMQVTSKPLRITVTVNKANYTHDLIAESGVFTVSLLDQSAPFGLFQHFGFQSGRDTDKFKDLSVKEDVNGVPYLTWASCGYLSCQVVSSMDWARIHSSLPMSSTQRRWRAPHRSAMPIIRNISSPSRSPRKMPLSRVGSAPSAAISTRVKRCRRISSAPSASMA